MAKGIVIYGAGLIAAEWYRYLMRKSKVQGRTVVFSVTDISNQLEKVCGKSVVSIDCVQKNYADYDIYVAMQEKFHEEVSVELSKRGLEPRLIVGLKELTRLLKEEVIDGIQCSLPGVKASVDEFDYSTVVLQKKTDDGMKFKFFPIAQLPLSKVEIDTIRQYVCKDVFWQRIGPYYNPEKFYHGIGKKGQTQIFIGMAASAKDATIRTYSTDSFVKRVFAGAAMGRNNCIGLTDARGENISRFNYDYAELTVSYWMWKNIKDADYIGLCHYRRQFNLGEKVLPLLQCEAIDVVLTCPRLVFPNIIEHFCNETITKFNRQDCSLMLDIIADTDRKIREFAETLLSGNCYVPNNMVIARRRIFAEYCEWTFGILEKMRIYYEKKGIVRNDRYLAYAGELITTIYFAYYHDRYKTVYVDYKLLS